MINLAKGQKVSLSKEAPGLSQMVVGLGWDVNRSGGKDYDLDAGVICLRNGKFTQKSDLCYFGNLRILNGAVVHGGDNLTGEGEGDDERVFINLATVPADVDKMVVVVTIYRGKQRRQDFAHVENAFIRICDQGGREVLRYSLTESFQNCTGMIFGEIYRHNGDWKFNPIGQGIKEDVMEKVAASYR